mmetsp:Transcript_14871/g.26715  ORF Transcript_14871/g.26715 Transcript_14871/m.26715 type:complete len:187 (+) Transcript_14871:330-890(+)
MSPFKGQGANQALQDGPHLADCLVKCKATKKNTNGIRAAVSCFEREMVARSAPKVEASREACAIFHSPQALFTTDGFAGVPKKSVGEFLSKLKAHGIGATWEGKLDAKIKEVLKVLRSERKEDFDEEAQVLAQRKIKSLKCPGCKKLMDISEYSKRQLKAGLGVAECRRCVEARRLCATASRRNYR